MGNLESGKIEIMTDCDQGHVRTRVPEPVTAENKIFEELKSFFLKKGTKIMSSLS